MTATTPAVAGAREDEPRAPRTRSWFWLGPAFVASMAYVDPGNFGTNFVAGSVAGYRLVWVVVAANLTAMFVQALSAKLGLATGRSLAAGCRERYRRPVVWVLWAQAELMGVATDVAEIVGGAIALHLLVGIPTSLGGLVTAAAAVVVLAMQTRGRRFYEIAVVVFLLVIVAALAYVAIGAPVNMARAGRGLVPDFGGSEGFLLAAGILGATVMPHVVYLHSSLVADLDPSTVRDETRVLRLQRAEIVLALGLAGIANLAMLLVAASTRSGSGSRTDGALDRVHAVLESAIGHPAATAFALALLASGLASASVGTLAGQTLMQDFVERSIPLAVRRAVTLVPALVILNVGLDATTALVLSQVVLSVALPFALLPLIALTRDPRVMGPLRNRRRTTVVAYGLSAVVVTLNVTALVAAAA